MNTCARAREACIAGLAALLLAGVAWADDVSVGGSVPRGAAEVVKVRVGNHPTYTRVVFELDASAGYRVEKLPARDGTSEIRVTLDASARPVQVDRKTVMVERVALDQGSGRSVAHIRLKKTPSRVKEMILANPPRIVFDLVFPEEQLAAIRRAERRKAQAKAAQQAAAREPGAATPTPAPVAKAEPSKALPSARPPTPKPAGKAAVPTPAPVAKAEPSKALPSAKPPTPKPAGKAALPTPAPVAKAEPSKALPSAKPPTPKPAEKAALPTPAPVAKAEPPKTLPGAKPPATPAEKPARPKPEEKPELAKTPPLRPAPAQKPPAARPADATAAKPQPAPGLLDGIDVVFWGSVAAGAILLVLVVVLVMRRRSLPNDMDVTAVAEEQAGEGAIPEGGFAMDDGGAPLDAATVAESFTSGATSPRVESRSAEVDIAAGPGLFDEEEPEKESETMDVERTGMDQTSSEMPTQVGAGAGGADVTRLVRDLERRMAQLETRLDEATEARERLERQVAAQAEELRVQRAAIARTQRALRSLNRPAEEQATEPALRDQS